MTPLLATRVHLLITFVLVTWATIVGAGFGLLLGGRITAAAAAAAGGPCAPGSGLGAGPRGGGAGGAARGRSPAL
ncbi:hypothetical protein, partial [Streptomyces sp. NPDC059134]|uniref:hypothetical protein n=1 Tax=Streptomyces sp. NPDC059134 TaxID=3346738 RepID=UPI003680AC7A